MSVFGKTLFGGSRFIFRALAPVLALCGIGLPFFITRWSVTSLLCVSLVEALLLAFILGLYDPRRFRWATRCVTGTVFCAYLAYLVDELFLSGKSIEAGSASRAEASPRNAIMGFIAIGLPCLWYTIFGRFSLRSQAQPDGGGPEPSEKLDQIDADF